MGVGKSGVRRGGFLARLQDDGVAGVHDRSSRGLADSLFGFLGFGG